MYNWEYWVVIAGMGLVTYIPRWLPLVVLAHRRLPPTLAAWLDLIPVAVLSALLAPILLIQADSPHLDIPKLEFWIAIPTFMFAIKTRSLGGTVLLGMFLFWLAGNLL